MANEQIKICLSREALGAGVCLDRYRGHRFTSVQSVFTGCTAVRDRVDGQDMTTGRAMFDLQVIARGRVETITMIAQQANTHTRLQADDPAWLEVLNGIYGTGRESFVRAYGERRQFMESTADEHGAIETVIANAVGVPALFYGGVCFVPAWLRPALDIFFESTAIGGSRRDRVQTQPKLCSLFFSGAASRRLLGALRLAALDVDFRGALLTVIDMIDPYAVDHAEIVDAWIASTPPSDRAKSFRDAVSRIHAMRLGSNTGCEFVHVREDQ